MTQYLYHITTTAVARIIRTKGLTPAAHPEALGRPVARRHGAFEVNRAAQEPGRQVNRLKAYLKKGLDAGYSLDQIRAGQRPFTPIPVVPAGNRDDEQVEITRVEAAEVKAFLAALGAPANRPSRLPTAQLRALGEQADDMLRTRKANALCRLAVHTVSLEYAIEEGMTSRHVYFSRPERASDCYSSYTGQHGGAAQCSVLRVARGAAAPLLDDPSDFRAVMTQRRILPQQIEIWRAPSGVLFTNANDRAEAGNWMPLTQWS
ncbi:conserved hypothethical protein (plasmid) [Ralstonia solanacearum CMR15]|nr:conserved hypothethical protein [Ralstonia solanacearum CMR15]